MKTIVSDKLVGFDEDPNDGLLIRHTQDIPEEHLSSLRLERADSLSSPAGDFHRVASIPTITIERWDREGFDWQGELSSGPAGLRKVLDKLNREALDAFITSNRRI